MLLKMLLFTGMITLIVLSFITPAPQKVIGEVSRIFYYHVPLAWVSVLAFAMSMIYSIRYLRTRNLAFDDRAESAARLGFVFCILATVTGSIFARVAWGSFWNWDPRETSVFILLLIYGAYLALRGVIEIEEKKAALSAVYSIFAFLAVPFLVFAVPRLVPSLHPSDSVVGGDMQFAMGPMVGLVFFSSLVLFTVLFLWIFSLTTRIRNLERFQAEKEN